MIIKTGLCSVMWNFEEFEAEYKKQNQSASKKTEDQMWLLYDKYRHAYMTA